MGTREQIVRIGEAELEGDQPLCCVGCMELVPLEANTKGWRWTTMYDGNHAWMCPECLLGDVDGPQY